MADPGTRLKRELEGIELRPFEVNDFHVRRDRKRRNQRIAAGVVGVAVFVAAIGLVTTFGSPDRTQPGASGGAGIGPAATQTQPADAHWDGEGLPPEGTELSTPTEGQLIGEYREIHVGFIYVYWDGRVIWHPDLGGVLERRLTPEGVDLVRSGATEPEDLLPVVSGVPTSAWADAGSRPYAPPRYAVCNGDPGGYEDPSHLLRLLPAPAEAVLQGKERTYRPGTVDRRHGEEVVECFEVTTEEARDLDQILEAAGFQTGGEAFFGFSRMNDEAGVSFEPILPHGTWHFWGG
jgi:hypothetical protein